MRRARLIFDRQLADEAFVKASIEFVQAQTEWLRLQAIPPDKNIEKQAKQLSAERGASMKLFHADNRLYRLFTEGKGNTKTLTLNSAYNAFRGRLLLTHHERES